MLSFLAAILMATFLFTVSLLSTVAFLVVSYFLSPEKRVSAAI